MTTFIDSLVSMCRNDINATDPMGQTALFATIAACRFDLFKSLINDHKANRKVVDVKGMNLYHWAKEHEDTLVPETLKFAKFIKKLDAAEAAEEAAKAKKLAAEKKRKKIEAAFLKEVRKQKFKN
jgi:hypothetical protein